MSLYGGHEPGTPPGAEAALDDLIGQLEEARGALEQARNDEVAAKHALGAAKRRWMFDTDCPRVARDAHTVAYREAWIEDRVADEQLAFDLAVARRQAARDHHETLRAQISAQQSIARSVGTTYAGLGREGW